MPSPVEADNAAALKASDVRTTGRDASLSSAPTDTIEHLCNTVVAADREIKRSHVDADRYRAEIVRLQAALERAEDRVEKWHNKVCKQEAEIERLRKRVAELERMEDERESREGWLKP